MLAFVENYSMILSRHNLCRPKTEPTCFGLLFRCIPNSVAMSSSWRYHSSSYESYDELIYTQMRIGLLIQRTNKNIEMKRGRLSGRHTFEHLACARCRPGAQAGGGLPQRIHVGGIQIVVAAPTIQPGWTRRGEWRGLGFPRRRRRRLSAAGLPEKRGWRNRRQWERARRIELSGWLSR
jgi:hypothetical protein